jgi:L-lactate dehydrogenase
MRIAILGLGAVGEACAHLLVSRGTARSLVLANRSLGIAEAIRMDLEQSRAWAAPLSARTVEPWRPGAFEGCDAVILTAGPRLRGSESRADKARQTAELIRGRPGSSILDALAACRRQVPPILVVVTNPVEATVTWLAEATGWPRNRILGLGTTVETARFSRFLADHLNVDATSVWTEIIGEHGPQIEIRDADAFKRRVHELRGTVDGDDLLKRTVEAAADIRALSEIAGSVAATRVIEGLRQSLGDRIGSEVLEAVRERLSAELCPPATRFAIAAAVVEVIDAIGNDRGRVLPVSCVCDAPYAPGVALALPCPIGAAGILDPPSIPDSELLRAAAASIEAQVRAMREVGAAP